MSAPGWARGTRPVTRRCRRRRAAPAAPYGRVVRAPGRARSWAALHPGWLYGPGRVRRCGTRPCGRPVRLSRTRTGGTRCVPSARRSPAASGPRPRSRPGSGRPARRRCRPGQPHRARGRWPYARAYGRRPVRVRFRTPVPVRNRVRPGRYGRGGRYGFRLIGRYGRGVAEQVGQPGAERERDHRQARHEGHHRPRGRGARGRRTAGGRSPARPCRARASRPPSGPAYLRARAEMPGVSQARSA